MLFVNHFARMALWRLIIAQQPLFRKRWQFDSINISTIAATQNVGYRIGGNYVLWHNGLTNCLYLGVGAGNINTLDVTNCTFVGNNVGNANIVYDNAAKGYQSLIHNTYGTYNTAMGSGALYTQSYSSGDTVYATDNTAVGFRALYSNQPYS
jgi:hypothetical protein